MRGIHRWPVISPHKEPVTRKIFPFDDVIMVRTGLQVFRTQIVFNHCAQRRFSVSGIPGRSGFYGADSAIPFRGDPIISKHSFGLILSALSVCRKALSLWGVEHNFTRKFTNKCRWFAYLRDFHHFRIENDTVSYIFQTLSGAKFSSGGLKNNNIYLYFLPYLSTEMSHAVEILFQCKTSYIAQPMPAVVRRMEPRHQ